MSDATSKRSICLVMNFRFINAFDVLLIIYMLLSLRVLGVVSGSPSVVAVAWFAMHLLMVALMIKARLWELCFENRSVYGFTAAIITVCALLSSFWSVLPFETFKMALYLALYTLGVTFWLHISGVRKCTRILTVVLTFVVLVSICVVLTGLSFTSDSVGLFPHKNIFGRLSALLVSLWLWWALMERGNLFACGLGMITGVFGVYLANSAGSVFVLFASLGGVVVYVGLRKIGITGFFLPLIVIFVTSMSASLLLEDWLGWLDFFGKSESLSGRTFLWSYAIQNIQEHPYFGHGYAAFWKASSINVLISNDITWQAPHAHNGYLDLALDLGVVIAGLYLVALIWVLVISLSSAPSSQGTLRIVLACFLLSANLLEKGSVLHHDVHYLLFLLLLFLSRKGSEKVGGRVTRSYLEGVK